MAFPTFPYRIIGQVEAASIPTAKAANAERAAAVRILEAYQLHVLLSAGDPDAAQAAPLWRRVSAAS